MATSNRWSLEITRRLRGSDCGRSGRRYNPTAEKISARRELIRLRKSGHPYDEAAVRAALRNFDRLSGPISNINPINP